MTEGKFQARDGLQLHYRFYPKDDARQTLVILHGHGEHSGRYEKFRDHLKSQPYHLAIYDARGHGNSEGEEVFVNSFEEFIEDVGSFLDFLKGRHRVSEPVVLLGHSNGGLVAVHWACRNPGRIKALILSSPCLGIRLPTWVGGLNRIIHRVNPRFIYRSPVYPPHLTHNAEEVAHYKADPMIKRKISARLLSEMIRYGDRVDRLDVSKTPFPVHILAAGLEKVVDLEKTKRFFELVRAPQKSLKIFDGFYHEIFNELDQAQAFAALNQILSNLSS